MNVGQFDYKKNMRCWFPGKPNRCGSPNTLFVGVLAMKGKGSMHHKKEVTSQVLRGKTQPKRYSNASAMLRGVTQSIGGRYYSADTLSNT